MKEEVGKRIEIIRKEMKLTKEGLAKKIGITGQFLGIVENGKSTLSYEKLKRLCDISGYSADYILFGKNKDIINETREKFNDLNEYQIQEACEILKKIGEFIRSNN